ncbi:MAG: kelch repeat-containing protein [Chthoniobacteraceae bacterium]
MLLSDGTVLAFNSNTSNAVYRLTPDSQGHYTNGTWTTIAPMNNTRLYFASQVLKDGRVFVAGGEYGTGGSAGETYNPLTNTWTLAATQAQRFSDANSIILPDGRVVVALVEGTLRSTVIFDPATNAWSTGPTCNGIHNESAWMKLPDDSVLMVARNTTNSERLIPSLNQWLPDATVPVALYDPFGLETGGALLLPNGKAFLIGALGHNALYTPSGSTANGSWLAAPDFPGGKGAPDAPAAMLPNGKVLCTVSPIPVSGNVFQSPTTFYEYDYVANSFTSVPTPTGATLNHPSFYGTMLVVPDGTVLYADFNNQIYSYQHDGAPLAAGKPAINSFTLNGDGSYHLVGTQFNGISEGSTYGDDAQNSTNYPIVKLTSGSNVYFCRSYNWSSTSVRTGATLVSTEFKVPAIVPVGSYSLAVVANGISSDPTPFTVVAGPVMVVNGAGGLNAVGNFGGPFSSSIAYTVSNAGNAPLDWTAAGTANWVSVSPASGTLGIGAATTVTVSVNANASTLAPGSYSDIVTFTNVNTAQGNTTRAAALTVTAFPALTVTPAAGVTAYGRYGGPFTAFNGTFTLRNTGIGSMDWTAGKNADWLTLSVTSGTLAPGDSATVTATINAAANTLEPGGYEDAIRFTNTSSNLGNTTRSVPLSVVLVAPTFVVEPPLSGGSTNTISWNPVAGAGHYEVKCSNGVTSGFITGTSFAFTGLNSGAYSYQVRSRRTAADVTVSAWSGVMTAAQDATLPAVANTGITTTLLATIVLQGTASDGAGVQSVTAGGNAAQTSDAFAHWSVAVSGLTAGLNTVTLTASDNASPPNVRTQNVTITRLLDADTDGLPDVWQDARGLTGGDRGPTADPDHNGLNNLLEYAFNLAPGASGFPGLPAVAVALNPDDGKLHLHLSYQHWIDGGGLQYVVETATDFANWSSANGDYSADGAPVPNGDGVTETVNLWINPSTELVPLKAVRLHIFGP